ncbi:MAG: hypothetical protein IT210_25660 [Armatimonadetes bacterium]|nr:hypothetical protein [Armatimonadota bacterium]
MTDDIMTQFGQALWRIAAVSPENTAQAQGLGRGLRAAWRLSAHPAIPAIIT